jgi:LuxR family transcriptional regulator, quorum-sensing system regulator BjaR1
LHSQRGAGNLSSDANVKPFWGLHGSFHITVSMTEARARSHRSKPSAVEFYRGLQECRDIESCAALFKTFVAAYNVDVFACGEVDLDNKGLSFFYFVEWPEAWRKFYVAANLVARDPIVEGARQYRSPYTWTDLRRDRRWDRGAAEVFRLTRLHGWYDGLVVPVPRGGSCYGLVSLVVRSSLLSVQSRTHLSLASECLLARMRSLGPPERLPASPSGLTQREIDALRLVAVGRTDAEIADSLGISQITAHQHVEGARKRLQARSRASMVAKGMTLGIVWLGSSQFDPSKA